jgi:hypothetical protein
MPSVHNGIGTWYYGRNNIHRRVNFCSHCNRVGKLESYDTTLYFVVFFIPVIPLGGKRVLEACPSCKKHHVLSLSNWKQNKERAVAEASELLAANPTAPVALQKAVEVSVAYQDEAALDEAAAAVAAAPTVTAPLLLNISDAFSYFSRWSEAEQACRAALERERSPAAERKLALILLKQGNPASAEPLLQCIWKEKDKANIGMVDLLIQGYQSQGMHAQALTVMDACEQAFPELSRDKSFQSRRKISTKHEATGKKVASAFLSESGKVGASEGSWTSRLPKIVFPVLLVAAVCAYFSVALWQGTHRKVFLVNGTNKAYAASVNGVEYQLLPNQATPISIAEGDVQVKVLDPRFPAEPLVCHIETPFLSRPVSSKTYVINPDQAALVVWQETEYVPQGKPHPEQRTALHVAKLLHEFEHINYEFAEFPATLKVKEHEKAVRTRVGLATGRSSADRFQLAMQKLQPSEQLAYARRYVALDPDDDYALTWLVNMLPPEEALTLLRPGLKERPIKVEWHRLYQALMEENHPDQDLVEQYTALARELNRSPDALYLLARLKEGNEAEKLLQEAISSAAPSTRALSSLGFRKLATGQFGEAVAILSKASPMVSPDSRENLIYLSALRATGDHDKLASRLQQLEQAPRFYWLAKAYLVQDQAARGDTRGVRQTIDEIRKQNLTDPRALPILAHLEAVRACGAGDVQGYLKALPLDERTSAFAPVLLAGDLAKAAALIRPGVRNQTAAQRSLLYLMALKKKDAPLANSQRKLLLEELAHGDRHHRVLGKVLAGTVPVNPVDLQQLLIDPDAKRALLLVVAQRFPASAKDIVPLARKLDFHHDETSLCLKALR